MTVRALAGLAALNLAYALVGLALLWGVPRLSHVGRRAAARRARVPARRRRVRGRLDGAARRGRPVRRARDRGVARRSRCGRRRRRAAPPGGRPARPRRCRARTPIVLVSAAGIALAGLFLEALFRAARLQSLQAYDAWAFWVPKGKAIFFFGGLDEHVFTTTPNPSYPPLQPILDAAAFHAMGGADVGHPAPAVLVSRRRRRRRGRRVAASARPRVAALAVPPARPRRAALRRATADAAGGHPRGRLRRRRGSAARALAPRPRRLAPRRGRGVARRCGEHEARGHPVRGMRRSPSRSSSPGPGTGRGSPLRLSPWVSPSFRGASGPQRHDIPSGAPSSFGRRPTRRRRRPLVRRSLLERALVGRADRRDDRARRRRGLGRSAAGGVRRASRLLLFAGGVWSTVGFEELAITADESGNPIVRYTGSIVLLAAVATPLLLCSVWRRGEEP